MMNILLKFLCVCLLLSSSSHAQIKDERGAQRKSTYFYDNLEVEGVPSEFMDLLVEHREFGDRCQPPANEAQAIAFRNQILQNTAKIQNYPNADIYVEKIIQTTPSPNLRRFAERVSSQVLVMTPEKLDKMRYDILNASWGGSELLDSKYADYFGLLIKYGNDSDISLWDSVWEQMSGIQKSHYAVYREGLLAAIKDKRERSSSQLPEGPMVQGNMESKGFVEKLSTQIGLLIVVALIFIVILFFYRRGNSLIM